MKPAVLLLLALCAAAGAAQTSTTSPTPLSDGDRQRIEVRLRELSDRLAALGAKRIDPALVADADVYRRAAELILRFPEEFATDAFAADTLTVIDEGLARARELATGAPSW